MRISSTVEAAAAVLVGIVTALLIVIITSCGAEPPRIESGRIRGAITLETPSGPVVVDLETQAIVAPQAGWSVTGYEAAAEAVITYQAIAHKVTISARNKCGRIEYIGVAALDMQIPGTDCTEHPTEARAE